MGIQSQSRHIKESLKKSEFSANTEIHFKDFLQQCQFMI